MGTCQNEKILLSNFATVPSIERRVLVVCGLLVSNQLWLSRVFIALQPTNILNEEPLCTNSRVLPFFAICTLSFSYFTLCNSILVDGAIVIGTVSSSTLVNSKPKSSAVESEILLINR